MTGNVQETPLNGVRSKISKTQFWQPGVLHCGTLPPRQTAKTRITCPAYTQEWVLRTSHPTMETRSASYILEAPGGSCQRSERGYVNFHWREVCNKRICGRDRPALTAEALPSRTIDVSSSSTDTRAAVAPVSSKAKPAQPHAPPEGS